MNEREPILVVGGGAIGGVVATGLAAGGADVQLVDADDAHLAAIREGGLNIEGARTGNWRLSACRPEAIVGTYRWAFLAVKSQHTVDAVAALAPHLAADGTLVSLQNGLNESWLAERLGAARVVGAVIHLAADQLAPGRIVRHAEGEFLVGELDGRLTPRVEQVAALLRLVAPTRVTPNIWGWLWTKQIYGCLLVASALSDETIGELVVRQAGRDVLAAALIEATEVALADGAQLEDYGTFRPTDLLPGPGDAAQRAGAALDRIGAESMKGQSGMWRDIKLKGRRSESDQITGEVLARAEQLGIAAPVNAAVLAMIHEIEGGQRPMAPENFDALAPLAGDWVRAIAPPVARPRAH